MMFINLRDLPTTRAVVDRSRHVSGISFPVDGFQNKCLLFVEYRSSGDVPISERLILKLKNQLLWSDLVPADHIDGAWGL